MFSPIIIPSLQEKEREKREKDKEGKEKDKKAVNGHVFTPVSSGQAAQCSQCNKTFNSKEVFHCTCKYYCLFFCLSSFLIFHCSFTLLVADHGHCCCNQSSKSAVILYLFL